MSRRSKSIRFYRGDCDRYVTAHARKRRVTITAVVAGDVYVGVNLDASQVGKLARYLASQERWLKAKGK